MKAKKKIIAQKTPEDYGVDVTPRLTTLKVESPPARATGITVADAHELVEKLRDDAGVI